MATNAQILWLVLQLLLAILLTLLPHRRRLHIAPQVKSPALIMQIADVVILLAVFLGVFIVEGLCLLELEWL